MNWDAIGAIAELVGALGVVASLAYLAVQIRQSTAQSRLNTTAIEASSFQQLLDHHSKYNLQLLDDAALLKTLLAQDREDLDPLEKQRFIIWASSVIRSNYNAWCLFQKGLISDDQLKLFQIAATRALSGPLGSEAWSLRRSEYPTEFVHSIEEAVVR